MMVVILLNKIKTSVGASSEHLLRESLSSFKRFVQTADSSDVYAWDNFDSTDSFKPLNHSAMNRLVAVVPPKM